MMSRRCADTTAGWSATVACSMRQFSRREPGVVAHTRGRTDIWLGARRAGAGAAGGLGAALLALGAELRSGVETVLDLVGFDERVRDVDLVITGEGNMDEQSAAGKAPVGVARRARRYGQAGGSPSWAAVLTT